MRTLAALIFLCGALSTFAETVKVDFSFDATGKTTDKNYLIYQADKDKTNDRYDAVSGASLAFSTKTLTASRLPDALQKLLLFAVSPPESAESDALSVEQSDDGSIDVTFVHRGVAYWIESDKRGNIDFEQGFSYAVIGERIGGEWCIQSDFTLDEADGTDMHSVDWEAVEFEDDKLKDYIGKKLTRRFAKIGYKDGILTLKIKLVWKDERNKG